jgi:hypothetical protein
MKRSVFLRGLLIVVAFSIYFSCSNAVDINNESAVLKDIQGAWTGYQMVGNAYRHFKLIVKNNSFEGWMQVADSEKEPSWAEIPDEKGALSLSSLQNDEEKRIKYRKFSLRCDGRCCGDKSVSVKALSELISYQEGKGLMLDGKVKMAKK